LFDDLRKSKRERNIYEKNRGIFVIRELTAIRVKRTGLVSESEICPWDARVFPQSTAAVFEGKWPRL
jgi:hypothetical protein